MINTAPREITNSLVSVRSTSSRITKNPPESLVSLVADRSYTSSRLHRKSVISVRRLVVDDSYTVTTLISTVIIPTQIVYSLDFTKYYNSMYLGLYL